MNEIVNKFLLTGEQFIPGMYLRLDVCIVFVDNFQKTKKE